MFELVSPYNRVIVPYKSIDLYHIGTRDNLTLQELETDTGIKKPDTYHCNNLNDLIEMASKLRYCEEGYVVRDANYKRIKVKSPAYVAASHLVNGMNEKRLLKLIQTNETEEFLTYFPEYKPQIDCLQHKIINLANHLDEILEKINLNRYETRKEFAEQVIQTKYPSFIFSYYDKKIHSSLEWIWLMSTDKLLEQLNH
jgi:hypothetical protein